MNPSFEATNAALLHFDQVDQPALDALRTKEAMNLSGFVLARRGAADRVRAAFLQDTRHINTPEIVSLLSVDRIRQAAGGTLLGRLLGFLP